MRHPTLSLLALATWGVLSAGPPPAARQAVPARAPAIEAADPRVEYLATLRVLGETLRRLQVTDPSHPEHGAIADPESGLFYTRAAEAVYPFAVIHRETGDAAWRDAAIRVGHWLIGKQEAHGGWVENPWDWTGTTADQLLMLALSWPVLEPHLDVAARTRWRASMIRAADYLVEKMSPEWASFNYVPTTAAALAAVWTHVAAEERFLRKARHLAQQSLAKLDEDYFFEGEAARVHGSKYGVDLGYQIDMSLWGLTLYARLARDADAEEAARQSMRRMLYFVYPNGAIDASWGARAYKWTSYGSKTADGAQATFALWADEDPRYQTAALRNLAYLRTAIREGLVGYGPDIWAMPGSRPNVYPTFARAKTLALALSFGRHQPPPTPPLPLDAGPLLRVFPSVQVAVLRNGPFAATISAYDYRDHANWGEGKYTHHPRGGAMVNLWVEGHGWLTTASQTRYVRGEAIHMPAIDGPIQPLTPRIEFTGPEGYFTNLYDADASLRVLEDGARQRIQVDGELADERAWPGGVGFQMVYDVGARALAKTVRLRYHHRFPDVAILEPIVVRDGVRVRQLDRRTVIVEGPGPVIRLVLEPGEGEWTVGERAEQFWQPFPGMRAVPVALRLAADPSRWRREVRYRYEVGAPPTTR